MIDASRRVLSLASLYPNPVQPRFGPFVARQMEALAKQGEWDVTVINPIGIPPIAFGRYNSLLPILGESVEHGVAVYRPRFTLIPKIGGPLNPWFIARAVLPLVRRLHAENPFSLVDAQFFYPDGPAAAMIARALGLPLSIKARGADIHYWGSRSYARKAMLAAGEQAAGLLSVSHALAQDMAALGLPKDKITIHYTGLDRDLFRPLQHEGLRKKLGDKLGIPLGPEPLLSCVGALIPRKGQEFVIRALPDLPQAQLLLVGKGDDKERLKALAAKLDVIHRVHFLGTIDHDLLPIILSASDAMVLPSASEGLANAWVEALACGTPLVICDAGGAKEIVTDASAGRLVPRDAKAIAEGIKDLLANRPAPQDVAVHAERFSWRANAETLARHYEKLVR